MGPVRASRSRIACCVSAALAHRYGWVPEAELGLGWARYIDGWVGSSGPGGASITALMRAWAYYQQYQYSYSTYDKLCFSLFFFPANAQL